MSEINKIRARVLEMNTYLPIFISENENNLDGIRSVLRTSCQENEKSLKILDEIYLGNKEDLSELNGALDELKKALIQSVENSENSNMDRQAVQKEIKMIVYNNIQPLECSTAVALGHFDGIHKGHRLVIGNAVKCRQKGLSPAVVTFSQNPVSVITGKKIPYLHPNIPPKYYHRYQ